ncbi:MAG: pantoate--beta-alanine ligase [Acidimicrobiaceae bacterium]|nr:pantoate--beta-alanine ligase [Acidimicrobiaceae bacterium]
MERLRTLASWREFAQSTRDAGRRVALVPTMGALHDGHASLVRRARENGDVVMLTSFVNPRQFNDTGDLSRYPHTPVLDADLARDSGVDALVTPTLEEMWPDYPADTLTTVSVRGLGDVLEGVERPGHFDGVASVVAKLFVLSGPCRAYFGEKDFQQLVVVRRMVRDLSFPVEVVGCPTMREPSGLALSSRNSRLSATGRERATALFRALRVARESTAHVSERRALMTEVLRAANVEVAYADIVDVDTLRPLSDGDLRPARALVAGFVEGVRLIDNAVIDLEPRS